MSQALEPVISYATQPAVDLLHHLTQGFTGAVYRQLCISLVQRAALLVEIMERLPRAQRHTAGVQIAETLRELILRQMQIDDMTDIAQMRHAVGLIYCAAAGSYDTFPEIKRCIDTALYLPEALYPVLGYQLTEEMPRALLYDQIAVAEAVSETLGKYDTYRALARAGHSYEYDIGLVHREALL